MPKIPPRVRKIIKKSRQGRSKFVGEEWREVNKSKKKAKAQGRSFSGKDEEETRAAFRAEQQAHRAQGAISIPT